MINLKELKASATRNLGLYPFTEIRDEELITLISELRRCAKGLEDLSKGAWPMEIDGNTYNHHEPYNLAKIILASLKEKVEL